jgi:hypothetical protein
MKKARSTEQLSNCADRRMVFLSTCLAFALGFCGCSRSPTPPVESASTQVAAPIHGANDPSWLTSREKLPPPEAERIEYDSKKRTLTLYDLPIPDSWMVQLPEETSGRLVAGRFQLPEGVDLKQTFVYYARAGSKVSLQVSVAQIRAGRASHPSLAIN